VVTVYEELPTGFNAPGNPNLFFPDYNQILSRFGAENYVRNLGVKEFWIWGYHHGNIVPAESNMSSPTTGDISNSNRFQDDLPVYNRTYTVYNYNFTRSAAEAVHNHGHQLEAILAHVNQRQDGNTYLFWRKFVGQNQNGTFITGRCGWTHMPPNTTADYDYANITLVDSDIEDWTPDRIGQTKLVNASTWGNIPYAWPNNAPPTQLTESKWYIYWMQNMPGRGNTIPHGQNRMTTWWAFTADWDASINAGLGLYEAASCSYSVSATPQLFEAGGGTGSVDITAGTGCARTATSNVAWITITSGSSGGGSGTVSYSVAANTNSSLRAGTIVIAGQTLTVTQAGSSGVVGLQYYSLPRPVRLLDTRLGAPACDAPGGPLAGGAVRTENARVTCGGITIPADAQAIVGNATAINTVPGGVAGYITLYPSGAPRPTVSNLNYVPNQIVPNAFTVGLGGDGAFNIYATSGVNFIVDITGYYAPPGTGGLYYHPLPTPVRLLDTRLGQPACDTPDTALTGGASRTQNLRTTCGGVTIPSSALVAVGNATVVNDVVGATDGYITLYPSGSGLPTASNLNYVPGQVVPNAFTVGLGGDGAFNIFASSSTNFIVDITGYYSDQATDINGTGLLYYALPNPVRLLDTRAGQPACDAPGTPLSSGATRTEAARTVCLGIPSIASVVVGNATVVNTTAGSASGYITLYPSGAAQPTVSNLNYVPGQVVPNSFTVGLGSDGAFNIYASSSTHFIADVTGYFAP